MQIENHLLDVAVKQFIEGGSHMDIRRIVIVHFTSGATAQSSVDFWKHQANGVLAHFIIDRDGKIIQCRPCNRTAGHAGVSRWLDPKVGVRKNCNDFAIGIELANAGDDPAVIEIAKKLHGYEGEQTLTHKLESTAKEWETFPAAQLDACFTLVATLKEKYNLDDVVGHEDVAPERKNDPGPAFPMQKLRKWLGLTLEPHVNWLG